MATNMAAVFEQETLSFSDSHNSEGKTGLCVCVCVCIHSSVWCYVHCAGDLHVHPIPVGWLKGCRLAAHFSLLMFLMCHLTPPSF